MERDTHEKGVRHIEAHTEVRRLIGGASRRGTHEKWVRTMHIGSVTAQAH